jgi:hypothetical protein
MEKILVANQLYWQCKHVVGICCSSWVTDTNLIPQHTSPSNVPTRQYDP